VVWLFRGARSSNWRGSCCNRAFPTLFTKTTSQRPILLQVVRPTKPSAGEIPALRWNSRTALSVPEPKLPSAPLARLAPFAINACWILITSAPLSPGRMDLRPDGNDSEHEPLLDPELLELPAPDVDPLPPEPAATSGPKPLHGRAVRLQTQSFRPLTTVV
jgi:hypothetical protein